MCPKPKLFTGYIELEMRLREFDRVRILYEKFLTVSFVYRLKQSSKLTSSMTHPSARPGFSGRRSKVPSKTLSVFELSLSLQSLSLWTCPRSFGRYSSSGLHEAGQADIQAYIDFEIEEAERERARHLYERLLERTSHVKVYISYALMEVSTLGGGEDEDGNEIEGEAGNEEMARGVFERGYKDLRARGEKEDVSQPHSNAS